MTLLEESKVELTQQREQLNSLYSLTRDEAVMQMLSAESNPDGTVVDRNSIFGCWETREISNVSSTQQVLASALSYQIVLLIPETSDGRTIAYESESLMLP